MLKAFEDCELAKSNYELHSAPAE